MSKYTKIFLGISACLMLAIGVAGQSGMDVPGYASQATSWLYASKPVQAVVVRESADTIKLTKEQVAWIGDPKLRADAKAVGITFLVVDPDVKDATGKTPADLVKAITLAKSKGLPRLILIGSRQGCVDYVLPVDGAAARKRLGI
jgi:hypothetical protein